MINYEKNNIEIQIKENYNELKSYRNTYNEIQELYNIYANTIDDYSNSEINPEDFGKKVAEYKEQIEKIDNASTILNEIEKNGSIFDLELINKYNEEYENIKENYIKSAMAEGTMSLNYIKELLFDFSNVIEEIKERHLKEIEEISKNDKKTDLEEFQNEFQNNDTLLISEVQGIVKLPYTVKEVQEILKNKDYRYKDENDVIKNMFTRLFSDYKFQTISRYNETMKLARERENYGLIDSITLALEMMKKKYLHPAIISACKSLNELDVYLDCLDKNEVDDFKIFKIKYELYPMVIIGKSRKNYYKKKSIINFFKKNRRIEKQFN